MKAIINGFRYNTQKAALIGEARHGLGGDLSHWEAGLYVTPRARRFFLAGNGGPMTRWGKPTTGGGTRGGDGIIPMIREDAMEWAEQNLTTDEVEGTFGDMIEEA